MRQALAAAQAPESGVVSASEEQSFADERAFSKPTCVSAVLRMLTMLMTNLLAG
jgi:hypothetical protein